MGGKKITGRLTTAYRDYLVAHLSKGITGVADLCAYFLLRAMSLTHEDGMLGLLATNTIAQGDTREVSLDQIEEQGGSIVRAIQSCKWPGSANLEVAHLWLKKGLWTGRFYLNDKEVSGITTFLTAPGLTTGNPHRLAANAEKSFIGPIVLGMGFTLSPEEARLLIQIDPRNRDVLFPYLSGEDITTRPDQSPSRWVINFHNWPLEKAEEYPDCIRIVRERVKPERDQKNRKAHRENWWQFAERQTALYAAITGFKRVLFHGFTSKYICFCFVPSDIVHAGPHVVIALEGFEYFAVLQSFAHECWAFRYCSTHETRLRYAPTDLFATFPFPRELAALDAVGDRYYECRREITLRRREGLTTTYNRFHDRDETSADIERLRALHVEMDRAVAASYGWSDVDLGHGFHDTKQGVRFTISESARHTVLDRLLELNHQRYEEEVRAGLHEKNMKGTKSGNRGRKKADQMEMNSSQSGLF